ncbi:MAG: hypothetical protein GC162_03725 [Planctomycetes bacterium]|nr:hypothetical protein [Planctomycetota bacterium]
MMWSTHSPRALFVSRLAQINFAIVAAVVGFAAWSLTWGILTPGDQFGNGSRLLIPSMLAAIGVGIGSGWQINARWFRVVLLIALMGVLVFFLCVRDDWWVTPPPMP